MQTITIDIWQGESIWTYEGVHETVDEACAAAVEGINADWDDDFADWSDLERRVGGAFIIPHGAVMAPRISVAELEALRNRTAYITTLETKHGLSIWVGATQAQATHQLADYCREGWADSYIYEPGTADEDMQDPDTMTDDAVIDAYFADDQMGQHEYYNERGRFAIDQPFEARPDKCTTCNGLGADPVGGTDCADCFGGGDIVAFPHDGKPVIAGQLPHETATDAQNRRAADLMTGSN